MTVFDLPATAGPPVAKGPLIVTKSGVHRAMAYRDVYVQGDGVKASFIGGTFRNPGGSKMLMAGMTPFGGVAGKPQVTADQALFDLTGISNASAAPIQGSDGASMTIKRSRLIEASRSFITWGGLTPGVLDVEDTFFGAFGINTDAVDHGEPVHVFSGVARFLRCLFDPKKGSKIVSGITCVAPYFEAYNAPVDGLLDGGAVVGVTENRCPWTIQACARFFDGALTVRNMILQRGSSGYVGVTELNGHKFTLTDGGGNIDADTRQPILSLT